jgi:hypothetical protein
MERLKISPANRGCNKAHIKHQVKCNKFNLIEQCNFAREECRIKPEQCEADSAMTDDNETYWLVEVRHG